RTGRSHPCQLDAVEENSFRLFWRSMRGGLDDGTSAQTKSESHLPRRLAGPIPSPPSAPPCLHTSPTLPSASHRGVRDVPGSVAEKDLRGGPGGPCPGFAAVPSP